MPERVSYPFGETPRELILERLPSGRQELMLAHTDGGGANRLQLEPGDMLTILDALLAEGGPNSLGLRATILHGLEIGEA